MQHEGSKRRYLVMPGRGISSSVMESSVFQSKMAGELTNQLDARLLAFESPTANSAFTTARSARVEIAAAIDDPDFTVVSQRFEDGPAIVRMTDAARLALEAGNPDLRVFPITRYYLPGEGPKGSMKQAARAASHIAAESALDAAGSVFMDDAKQHFVAGIDPGEPDGTGVLVGVVDTGVDSTHPALQGRVVVSRCLIEGAVPTAGGPVNWGPGRRDRAGHGTHVAGIIAAAPGSGGPAGVAPGARIASYRIFPDSHDGSSAENPAIIDSIRAAIDDGCHIINLSIEGRTLREDGVRSAIADAWENGVICVAAAGNGNGGPVSYPAALSHCVAVTAMGREGHFPTTPSFTMHVSGERAESDNSVFLASFSNFGPQVQFTAPGHAIVSTFPGGEWWFSSGTSMAAPYVAGMLARYLSGNGNVLRAVGNAQRSATMLQMLVARAHRLGLPQVAFEGYGLPG